MRRKQIIISSLVSACFLLLPLCSYLFLASESGTQLLFNMVKEHSNSKFSYDQVSGAMLGHLEITHLKLQNDAVNVNIDHVTASSSFNFFTFKLRVTKLELENTTVHPRLHRLQNKSTASGFKLPIQIEISQLLLTNTKITGSKNQEFIFPDLLGTLKYNSQKQYLLLHQAVNENALLSVYHDKKTAHVDIQTPFKKTVLGLHYNLKNKNSILKGEIVDSQGGTLKLEGTGDTNSLWVIDTTANNLHLRDLWPNYWPGTLNFNLHIQRQHDQTQINLKQLYGSIRNQPLEGRGYLDIGKQGINNLDIYLSSRNTKVIIQENSNASHSIDWLLKIPEIENFMPSIKGEINARGSIEALNSKPLIRGYFSGERISTSRGQLKQLKGDFLLNLKSDQPESYLQLSGTNFLKNKYMINNFNLEAKGALNKHNIKINAQAKDQVAAIQLLGKYEASQWFGDIKEFSFTNNKQKWILQKPAMLTANKKKISLETLLLVASNSFLSLQGEYLFQHGAKGKLEIKNLQLSLLNFFLPETYKIEGNVDIDAMGDLTKKQQLKVRVNLKPGAFYYNLNQEPQKNNFTSGNITALLDKSKLTAAGNINLSDGHITSQINSQDFNIKKDIKDQKIEGSINLQLSQINFFETLIPAIKNVTGKLNGNYIFNGKIAHPILKGSLELNQGAFKIPKLNIEAKNVNITAQSDMSNITYTGKLTSGNGTLSLTGYSKIGQENFPLNLDLEGDNLLICDKPEIKILASPHMHLLLAKNELKLSGKLVIPEANLHPHNFGGSESASDDIIFVQPDGKATENSNIRIISSIQLILGNKIFLNSHGIKGQVLGQIQIEDDPNKATVAYGQLWLQDGSYKVYGKTLQIDSGRLLFTGGPISNPGLSIKASRTLQARSNSLFAAEENIKVGVSVTGTLHDSKVNLFSEPAGKSAEDILSYLILGMPVSSINKSVGKSNAQLLLQAADAINLGGDNKLFSFKDKIKKGLGLAELDIGTQSEIDPSTQETIQHTAFVLGKYLSPKFYVNYSLDLFDHTNTLKVRYLLNRFWTVQSVANTNGSGVDILYTVEK